jgi:hypothetical protein
MVAQGKHHNTIVAAIARELTGYVWAVLRMVEPTKI